MIAYLLRSLVQAAIVLLAVALLAFSMFRFVGDPIANLAGQEATQADREELRKHLGLEDSILVQFGRFVGGAVKGEFGISYKQGRKVSDLLAERLPATLELALLSTILATGLGIAFGVYTAIRRDGLIANAIMVLSLVGVSLPTFIIGIGLIYLFAVELKWLPSYGRGDVSSFGWWTTGLLTESGRRSLVLPVLTLGFFQLTLIMRLVRSEMLEVLRADYIKFARARGLPDRIVYFGHALKNTMVPVITITGLQLGALIAFAIITETVFQWPGMGLLFIQAVTFADIPVMAAYLCLIALIFVLINLAVDLLYFVVDPRLRIDNAADAH